VILSSGNITINFSEEYSGDDISDSFTSTTYTIHTREYFGEEGTYYFEKISENSLNYTVSVNGNALGPIVLYKD
jgi:hypothetical protein